MTLQSKFYLNTGLSSIPIWSRLIGKSMFNMMALRRMGKRSHWWGGIKRTHLKAHERSDGEDLGRYLGKQRVDIFLALVLHAFVQGQSTTRRDTYELTRPHFVVGKCQLGYVWGMLNYGEPWSCSRGLSQRLMKKVWSETHLFHMALRLAQGKLSFHLCPAPKYEIVCSRLRWTNISSHHDNLMASSMSVVSSRI